MTCLGSKIKIRLIGNSGNAFPTELYLWPSFEPHPTTNAALEPMKTSPNVRHTTLPTDGNATRYMRYFMKTKNLYAVTNVFDDSSFRTVYQSNPVVPWYWYLFWNNLNLGQQVISFTLDVRITYYVAYHRKVMAPV